MCRWFDSAPGHQEHRSRNAHSCKWALSFLGCSSPRVGQFPVRPPRLETSRATCALGLRCTKSAQDRTMKGGTSDIVLRFVADCVRTAGVDAIKYVSFWPQARTVRKSLVCMRRRLNGRYSTFRIDPAASARRILLGRSVCSWSFTSLSNMENLTAIHAVLIRRQTIETLNTTRTTAPSFRNSVGRSSLYGNARFLLSP